MNKRKPIKVRASYARSRARVFLRELGLIGPPVKIEDLIRKFGDLIYDEDAGEGFSVFNKKKNKYGVFIDPRTIAGRITWTLCHELAHIVLGHLKDFRTKGLTEREEWILDREANIFVTNFLMPEEWINDHLTFPLCKLELARAKNLFDVSWEALILRLDELGLHSKQRSQELFEQQKLNKKKQSKGVNFCLSIKRGRGEIKLGKITFPEIDDNYRFKHCALCGNNIFSHDARYCKKCGTYLINDCTNVPYDSEGYCGKPNVSDALYCEYCGCQTLMGQLLDKEAAATIEFDDSDIPF